MLGPGVDVAAGSPIPGGFNVANTLAAVAAAATAGYDAGAVARAIAEGPGVPGRLERVDQGQDFAVVVDYAHKPDAVAAALATLRPLTAGRLIVVLGAGGDRDPGKRPFMGEIAAGAADLLVVTDDNPRSEDPAAIRAAILDGTGAGTAEVLEIGDRRAAIAEAVRRAGPGDIVLIAGKGHESGPGGRRGAAPLRRPRGRPRGAGPVIPLSLARIAAVVGGRLADAGDGSAAVTAPGVRGHPHPGAGRAVRCRPR